MHTLGLRAHIGEFYQVPILIVKLNSIQPDVEKVTVCRVQIDFDHKPDG
jgi:hypothetical protein